MDFGLATNLSALGALVLIIVALIRAISRGDWVPRRELDYLREDRDARLAEKDHEITTLWSVVETERTGREIVTEQNRVLLGGITPTLDRFFNALRALAAEGGRYVGDEPAPRPDGSAAAS